MDVPAPVDMATTTREPQIGLPQHDHAMTTSHGPPPPDLLTGLLQPPGGGANFATERQRRQQLNGKYAALRALVPNPTKKYDRASIVGDATEYVKELLRTVDEFKMLVQKKKKKMMIKSEEEAHLTN